MRIAVIADIHANVLALDAVLRDISLRGADLIIDLGDCVSGPLWPRETAERLGELNLPSVRGNHDRQVAFDPRAKLGASDAYAFDQLSVTQRAYFGRRPLTMRPSEGVLAFHATPEDDNKYLLEDVAGRGLGLTTSAKIADRLAGQIADLVLCGHSHQQRIVRTARNEGFSLVVNPGSVGCPAYDDGLLTPYAGAPATPHISESGSPHARYAIVAKRGAVWSAELFAIDYDWDCAAARCAENGRLDWARAVATGFIS
jgi:predicted phosphodiesterase